jgi:hypothetical protein
VTFWISILKRCQCRKGNTKRLTRIGEISVKPLRHHESEINSSPEGTRNRRSMSPRLWLTTISPNLVHCLILPLPNRESIGAADEH